MRRICTSATSGATRLALVTLLTLAGGLFSAASAAALTAHGQRLQLTHPSLNTNQSGNWSGYVQGALEQGGKLFNSISGDWTVPTATQHTKGEAEYSSDWIGIGGGCIDAACSINDPTLIQTGTEQDVSSSGTASYSAWWEVIPVPSVSQWPTDLSSMTVGPGDHMHASIAEVVPDSNLWTITLQDVTRGETKSFTVPYPSTHGTAEWIQETPVVFTSGSLFAPMPNLTSPKFDLATTNGAPANLKASEEMQLVDSGNHVVSTPSAPDPDADGFNACTWAGTCTAPSSS